MPKLLDGGTKVQLDSGEVRPTKQGEWYDGYHFFNNSLASQAGVIHPQAGVPGAGQAVSSEVNRQSDQAQGLKPGTIDKYVASQNQKQQIQQPTAGGGSSLNFAGTSTSFDGSSGNVGITQTPTIDLQGTYKSLYDSSGISDLEAELAGKERAYTEASGVVDDNPFLAESTRVGRQAKLRELFDKRTANIRNEIATKKADVETQLNLQLKQFDINSQQAQNALSQFNTLLSIGALDNASGETIANLTRSTGISSDMIYSAINAKKKGEEQTQVITSTNDAGIVTATVINPATGDIIKQTSLGAIGNAENSGGSTKINEAEVKNELVSDIRGGLGVRDIYSIYSDLLDPNDILRIYNSNSPYGPAKESAEELQLLGVDTEAFGIGSSDSKF